MKGQEIRILAYKRNALKGQLCFYRTALKYIDPRILSDTDHIKLVKYRQLIDELLDNWDPHYIKNRYSNRK